MEQDKIYVLKVGDMNTALVELIIFKCEDEVGEEWFIVEPADIPEKVKEPGVIEFLEAGCVAQFPGESTVYAGIKIGETWKPKLFSPIIMPSGIKKDG